MHQRIQVVGVVMMILTPIFACLCFTINLVCDECIETWWTKQKIPAVRERFQEVNNTFKDMRGDTLLSTAIVKPNVSEAEIINDCVYASASYTYGANEKYSDILNSYEELFSAIGLRKSENLPGVFYISPDRTFAINITLSKNNLDEWAKYESVYVVKIYYAEPSINCYTEYYW
jgi:hypothetical protein